MSAPAPAGNKPAALSLLSSERPRNVGWRSAAGLLFGDWGTSRLYVLGLAFFFAGPTSFWLILAMSGLILAVAWAYTQICRIYPDGGGVYTAAKQRSKMLAVVGALLLFADYTVTASLSALDAFHYFGLDHSEHLFALNSPGLWAIIAIAVIGALNLLGPKHTGGFAIAAALGMVAITVTITTGALPQIEWTKLPETIGPLHGSMSSIWLQFVSIVLALSGVEAIANLTGVMAKPVAQTARRAIWIVAIEVAILNVLLALAMAGAGDAVDQHEHRDDMLAFLSLHYVGPWAELGVRVLGGVLLLSAANTAIGGLIAVQYLLSRDGELPASLQKLNRLGVPLLPTLVAAGTPMLVLVFSHDLGQLAALYAIGVVGAVAINVSLCAFHPRLRGPVRKYSAIMLGILLLAIWITLAATKHAALVFVLIVMAVGLTLRWVTQRLAARRGPRPTLLQQAIREQINDAALAAPRVLICSYGSIDLADDALRYARQRGATLVLCFVREIALRPVWSAESLTLDTDVAAVRTFTRYLDLAHEQGVAIIPHYDTGADASIAIAEAAVIHRCDTILIGSSRQGLLHEVIKGNFQRRLESLLPAQIDIRVLSRGSVDEQVVVQPVPSCLST